MDTSDRDFEELVGAVRHNAESRVLARTLRAAAVTPAREARLALLAAALPAGAAARDELADLASGGNVVSLQDRRAPEQSRRVEAGFAGVGGLEEVKKQLGRRLRDRGAHGSLLTRFGRRAGGGLLLYGPPGCGKTMVARAAAAEAGARLIAIDAAGVLDGRVGWSERRIIAAFDEAREQRPALLFFDEVEALAGRRSNAAPYQASLVSAFLGAFDGMAERNDGVLVLAATNTPWAVDTAFRRPGRFDRSLFVPPPDRHARRAILAGLLADLPLGEAIDLDTLVERTVWFSGADLRALVEAGADEAIEETLETGAEVPLRPTHLLRALAEARPTTREWLATARNHARYANEGGVYDELLAFLERHER